MELHKKLSMISWAKMSLSHNVRSNLHLIFSSAVSNAKTPVIFSHPSRDVIDAIEAGDPEKDIWWQRRSSFLLLVLTVPDLGSPGG